MVNAKKIKNRMTELGITQKDIANSLKIAQPTVNQKINNTRPMNLEEAEQIATILQINNIDFYAYFFAKEIA